jgi:hypothetical protein
MINLPRDVRFSDAQSAMGNFTADLTDPAHAITFKDEEHPGRYMSVIVNRDYPGGFGLIVDRAAVTVLSNYFAALADEMR